MKPIEYHPNIDKLNVSTDKRKELQAFIVQEAHDALASRTPQEELWRDLLRMYEGVPKHPVRNVPVVNAPNIEVTLGATITDMVYAQAIDLIYTASPIVTVRATNETYVEDAKAMQEFVNWLVANEVDMRTASDHAFLDNIKLGTGVLYVPWVEREKKTKVRYVTYRGAMIRSIAPEDFVVPGGSDAAVDDAQWCAVRMYLTDYELKQRAKQLKWAISDAKPVGALSWIRNKREALGRTYTQALAKSRLYEIWDIYIYYDIDGDGLVEDLIVTWDRSSQKILKIQFNPYDRRPFEVMRYQLREHLFCGIGAMEMAKPFQEGATEQYNHWIINMMIANSRVWGGKEGVVSESTEIWPNKFIPITAKDDLFGIAMGDVYNSAPQAIATTLQFGQQRTGVNDLSQAGPQRLLGSRTPGITALSGLQQMNKRFTPAFDGMRMAMARSVMQCLYRYQEKVLAGDRLVQDKIMRIMGEGDGALIVERLRDREFDNNFTVELTAASASINRDADKQNSMMLLNILDQYYAKVAQLGMLAMNPQLPQPMRDLLMKIGHAMAEALDRTIRTFEQVRDPRTFIVDMEAELKAMDQMSQVQQLLSMMGQQAQQQQGEIGGTPEQGQGEASASPLAGPVG